MLPSNSKYDYFRQGYEEPEKRVHFQTDKKRQWQDDGTLPEQILFYYIWEESLIWTCR